MATKKNSAGSIQLKLRVLGYRNKEGTWAAHCLETDLVGRGKTFEEALRDLNELTEMQVSFAVFKKQLSLLDHPAPFEIYAAYERATSEALKTFPNSTRASGTAVDFLSLPPPPTPPAEFEPIGA